MSLPRKANSKQTDIKDAFADHDFYRSSPLPDTMKTNKLTVLVLETSATLPCERRIQTFQRAVAKIPALLLVLTAAIPQATDAALVFTNEASFISALSGTQVLLDFQTAAFGPINGSEFAAQGFIFDSPVNGPAGQLSIVTGAYLNIGRQPFAPEDDGNNDSLEVTMIGDWRALGFRFFDGLVPGNGESVTFYGDNDVILYSRSPLDGAVDYIGIIADSPIRRVSIVEAAGDFDDIGYDNFRLASVPEASTVLLGVLGAAGLLLNRRRQ